MKAKTNGTAEVSPDEHYTYKEYKSWPEGERWELIDGLAYAMSPAHTRSHQKFVVDLVVKLVEILSPSTAMKDLSKKKTLYAKHGVREYWIVNPEDLSVLAYRLEGKEFGRVQDYRAGEAVDSSALPGFSWKPGPW